ncbi:Flp family type IVb pilin [Neorhodopirellula pilleata]|nr:Flp family type IVb pilin [Neorhodopirellula pilleata]
MSSTTVFQSECISPIIRSIAPQSFRRFRSGFANWLRDEDGTTAVEYAVMVAMIAVACVTAVNLMSSAARDSFQNSAVAIGE